MSTDSGGAGYASPWVGHAAPPAFSVAAPHGLSSTVGSPSARRARGGARVDPCPPTPCQEHLDVDLWFAERTADVELAKLLCGPCPQRLGCLEGAIRRAEPWGVWGGESFLNGAVVAHKRGRGRPRKNAMENRAS